jgi:hypothetical protein
MIQRPKEKERSYKGHLSFSFGLCIICPFLLAFVSSGPFLLAFLSSGPFLLTFVSSVLFFWSYIICPFPLTFVSSVLFFCIKVKRKGPDDTKAKGKGQMIQRPKERDR